MHADVNLEFVSKDMAFAFILNPRRTTELENVAVFLVTPLLFTFENIRKGPLNLLLV